MHFTGSVNFRPVRIGFLVPPDNLSLVSRIARLSACLWGGRYNPIIPFFESGGSRWSKPRSDVEGLDVARGYVNFFEPDVLIETTPGMAEKLGWEHSDRIIGLPRVVSFGQLYTQDHRGALDFTVGINIIEVMIQLYNLEYKYERRHKQNFAKIVNVEGDAFFDLVCGRYPADAHFESINHAYSDIFLPTLLPADASTALRHLKEGLLGPLWVTAHELRESFGRSLRDQTFYVFDPTDPGDAIDYWNFRLVERRATPINVNWFDDCAAIMRERIERVHRPIPGNPYGTKFHSIICFASSISEARRSQLASQYLADLPGLALFFERDPHLWDRRGRGRQRKETKILATGTSISFDEETKPGGAVKIPAPAPAFLHRSGRYLKGRWINVVMPSAPFDDYTTAIVYPSNIWSPAYPMLARGERLRIGREGWILQREYEIGYSLLHLQNGRDAIIGWLKTQSFEAKPSEAGQIATQVILAAGGASSLRHVC